ncbi:MAG TPA: nuclear transport factor 2 family protein [Bryobacteraceae bacterium]|nr:nuclear transport factor 2 family protein [Bryobacteraceae bacterium]
MRGLRPTIAGATMEPHMNPDIRSFFEAFQRNNSADDIDAVVSQYADPFLHADPSGTRAVRTSDLKAALPKRKALLRSIGSKSTTLLSFEEQELDPLHVLVRAQWRWDFGENGDVTLPSTFILRRNGDTLKIVLYLNHHDIMAVLRERGLLSAATS